MNIAELKRQAVQYYTEHQIPGQIETLLNSLFYDKPNDLYGYMSNHFKRLAKSPVISEIKLYETINPSGYETVRLAVSCCVNGEIKEYFSLEPLKDKRSQKEQLSIKTLAATKVTNKKESKSRISKRDTVSQETSSEVSHQSLTSKDFALFNSFVSIIQTDVLPIIYHVDLHKQKDIDNKISSFLDEFSKKREAKSSLASVSPVPENSIVQIVEHPPSSANATTTDEASRQTSISSDTNEMVTSHLHEAAFFASILSSYALAVTQSKEWYLQLFERFSSGNNNRKLNSLPLPGISFVCSDLSSPGKLNMIKNVFVLPKLQSDWKQSLIKVITLYHSIDEELSSKHVVGKSKKGSFLLSFERAEQVFELLYNSCKTHLNEEFENIFDMIIDISANELYDEEKKKYEISMGTSKGGNELISTYSHWLESYPIIGLIDALCEKDVDNMELLCTELKDFCFIINSQNGIIEELARNCNGMYLRAEENCAHLTQLSETLRTINECEEERVLFMDDTWCSYQSRPLAVDLSVACNSLFFGSAAPTSYGSSSISRWLEIFCQLKELDAFKPRDTYGFKVRQSLEEDNIEVPT